MWHLVDEKNIADLYPTQIADFWASEVTQSHFVGKDGVTIHYAKAIPENAHHTIVFSNGRIETLIKYKEFIYECFNNGIAVFTLDHRGQGLSARMTLDRQRGFVDHFSDYVDDFCQFVTEIVSPEVTAKPTLVCHSMGSAIGFLSAARMPDAFQNAVFCSPMFGIKPAFPEPFLSTFLHAGLAANKLFGNRPWYAAGQHPYIEIPFAINTLTHSPTRYKLFREEYKKEPRIQLGGVTYHWLYQAISAMAEVKAKAPNFIIPTKVIMSGSDKVVDNEKIQAVVDSLPNVTAITIDGARHELLFELDKYRQPAVNAIFEFVSQPTQPNN